MGHGKQNDESWADYNRRASLSNDADDRRQYSDSDGDDHIGCGEIWLTIIFFAIVIMAMTFCGD